MSRRLGIAAALICATALTAGCAPDPDPTPTPTRFTSQAEAFAAAEKTYRAYVDATNSVDLSDPRTFEPVFDLTTETQLSDDKKALTSYHASGTSVTGESTIRTLVPLESDADLAEVQLAVCLDVSMVEVTDAEGKSLVNPDRVDVQSLLVTLQEDPIRNALLISDIDGREGKPSCS